MKLDVNRIRQWMKAAEFKGEKAKVRVHRKQDKVHNGPQDILLNEK